MSKNKIYCTKCGTENNINNADCIKCHEALNKKHHPLLEYMKSKIKGKFKGKLEDKAFSIIINYIKSNLYGVILSISVLASVTSVVVNVVVNNDTNDIQEVTEKPTIVNRITYVGDGLSAMELTRKYINAIDTNDIDTIKGLQLENFHKDIYDKIKEYSDTNLVYDYDVAATGHELVKNNKIYFSYNQDNIYIGPSELVRDTDTFGDYTTENFYVSIGYCSYNNCNGTYDYGVYYSAGIEVQLVNVDGNYYILGEKVAQMMGEDEYIMLRALHRANGDTTNFSFRNSLDEYYICDQDTNCLKENGWIE